MNRLAFALGILLTASGVALFPVIYWDCTHRVIGLPCPDPDPILILLILPLVAIGLVLIAYSFLTLRHHLSQLTGKSRLNGDLQSQQNPNAVSERKERSSEVTVLISRILSEARTQNVTDH
jgi:hypothetical protein